MIEKKKNEERVKESGSWMASLSDTADASNQLTLDFLFCEEKQRPIGFDQYFSMSVAIELNWRW